MQPATRSLAIALALLALVAAAPVAGPPGSVEVLPAGRAAGAAPVTGGAPGSFAENMGQVADPAVRYHTSLGGIAAAFGEGFVAVRIDPPPGGRGALLRVTFPGASSVAPEGLGRLPHRFHFFLGDDAAAWRADVPAFREVRYRDLYPGIDLTYRIDGGLKYEFLVRPGGDPAAIALRYEGAEGLSLAGGELVVRTSAGELRDARPIASQGAREVPCGFALRGSDAGFECGAWDPGEPLLIDPLVYATYLGGSLAEDGYAIAVDAEGNAFVAGRTVSANFPTTPGAFDRTIGGGGFADAFVAKLDPSGTTLLWATYLGGFDYDAAVSIAVDAQGRACLVGQTYSSNFPTTAGAYDTSHSGAGDGWVAMLAAAGDALVFSTFLGGSADDAPTGSSIAIDVSGNLVVAGRTESSNFPTTAGAFDRLYNGAGDAFVAKLSGNGSSLLFSTFLGSAGSEASVGVVIDLDGAGNVYLVGDTDGAAFPTTAGAYDATHNGGRDSFVASLDASGAVLRWSSFLGGSGEETGQFSRTIRLDAAGNVVVAGSTGSADFPATPGSWDTSLGGIRDAFAASLSPDGTALRWATYLGGGGDDYATGIGFDPAGRVYLTGATGSTDFPTIPGAIDGTLNGTSDAFLAVLAPAGNLLVGGTYFGGNSTDVAFSMALGGTGDAYLTGESASLDFPTTPGAFDRTYNGGSRDGFVVRLAPEFAPAFQITLDTLPGGLAVETDGVSRVAPYTFACATNSSYTIGAPSPQLAGTTRYSFSAWSDGGPRVHAVVCQANATYVASFSSEYLVIVNTVPDGLGFEFDGGTGTSPYGLWCASGTSHVLTAPSPQVAGPTRYVFANWSDGEGRSHTITCTAPAAYTARFTREFEVAVDTSPSGLRVEADGTTRATPFALWCPEGSTVALDVPPLQGDGIVRYRFAAWSDGGGPAHGVPCDGPRSLVAILEPNWKPVVALVLAVALAVTGAATALQERPPRGRGRHPVGRAWLGSALPFVAAESVIALVSWATGLLSIPPAIGLGTIVDGLALALGLTVQYWSWRRLREVAGTPPASPPAAPPLDPGAPP